MNFKLLRLLRRKRFYFSIVLVGFFAFAYDFFEMRTSDHSFYNLLQKNPFRYQSNVQYYTEPQRSIRYVEVGNDSLPLIVFIHGAPSSSAFWKDFLTDSFLISRAKLLAVDRPGYGYSGYGIPETSVQEQARLIAKIISAKRALHSKIVLHGSSYGGTVAARIAMDFPHLVDGLLLQSASVEPGAEKTYGITYLIRHWAVEWLLPGSFKVANREKLSHHRQLEKMKPLWDQIISPTIILHGTADSLIYPSNALFAKKHLTNAQSAELLMLQDRGHDLLWNKQELLVASLMKLLGDSTYHNLEAFNQ